MEPTSTYLLCVSSNSCVRGSMARSYQISHSLSLYLYVRYTVFNLVYREQSTSPRPFRMAELIDNRMCVEREFDSCVFNNDVIVTEKMWR